MESEAAFGDGDEHEGGDGEGDREGDEGVKGGTGGGVGEEVAVDACGGVEGVVGEDDGLAELRARATSPW